jgi:hypothetical protein
MEAMEKGPNAYAKRVVRRRIYRTSNRTIAKALRELHL